MTFLFMVGIVLYLLSFVFSVDVCTKPRRRGRTISGFGNGEMGLVLTEDEMALLNGGVQWADHLGSIFPLDREEKKKEVGERRPCSSSKIRLWIRLRKQPASWNSSGEKGSLYLSVCASVRRCGWQWVEWTVPLHAACCISHGLHSGPCESHIIVDRDWRPRTWKPFCSHKILCVFFFLLPNFVALILMSYVLRIHVTGCVKGRERPGLITELSAVCMRMHVTRVPQALWTGSKDTNRGWERLDIR